MTSGKTKGIYLALLTAFISGVSIFLNKFAVGAVTPPLYFTSVKNVAVGVLLISIVLASKKWHGIKKLSKRDLKYLVLIGIVGGSVPFYLYFTGLALVPAINAAIIHKTLVIWVAILAIPFLKEKISKLQASAVFMLFAGNLIVGGFESFQFSRGELLILIATILWSVENILAKKVLPTVAPDIVALFRMGLGSLLLMVATFIFVPNVAQKSLALTPMQIFWISLTILTLFGYVISWYRALKLAPAITVTSVLAGSTLVTNVLSAIFITHAWNGVLTAQALLLTAGLGLFVYSEKKKIKTRALNTL